MSAQVRHNGTNITGAVVSYERSHNICTSVGILTVEIVGNIGRTFDPWDTIDIYENGDFKVRYYISSVTKNNPKADIVLECQDISKKLVDYFIPQSYTIETPSYTRYWIELFLNEVGLDYEFTTASSGTLLSNFTQLGLVSAYEQLITLLQMSGWYMYFDGNEKAIIGSLNIDFATDIGSVGKTDILEIKKVSDDRMLRNRALVIGAYDAFRGTQAAADVSVHTPWNYDHRDVRTVVIANSNIPDNESAYGMANMLVKEFAKITVEKHIQVHGFRDFNLGTALRVTSNVWRGRGLVTTFGTSMSKQGFVTNVILDERCPRLFGFFDFGDYVYVGTFGDGIWRKHIKFDPTWYDFSSGLTDLNITDLHINQGVFGAVGASGEAYYAIDDVPWNQITLSSFMSSVQGQVDVTESGIIASGLELTAYSGLMARATIVDKANAFVRFGVDNLSGINTGDYFITESGNFASVSGVMGSGHRGWVVEYDVLNGDAAGTAYPITLSGSFEFFVVDLDNDGKNDYVSVGTVGDGITGTSPEYNFGYGNRHEYPLSSKRSWSELAGSVAAQQGTFNNVSSFGAIDDVGRHEIFWTTSTTFVVRKYSVDPDGEYSFESSTTVTLPVGITPVGQSGNADSGAGILTPSNGVYKFLAADNGVAADRYSVVTITHLGSESYSTEISGIINDVNVVVQSQNGRYVGLMKEDFSTFDRKLYAGKLDILTHTYSLDEVWSSGGTVTDRKDLKVRVWVLNGITQASGFQVEWNSGNTANKTLYPLHLEGTSLSKGSAIVTGNIAVPITITSQQVTRLHFVTTSTILSSVYAVYNDGTTTTVPAPFLTLHPILNAAFDGTALRVNNTTQRLEYSTVPITSWTEVNLGTNEPVTGPFAYLDTVTSNLYIRVEDSVGGADKIVAIDWSTKQITSSFTRFTVNSTTNPGTFYAYNIGNFAILINGNALGNMSYYLMQNLDPPLGEGTEFLVLRRDGTEYTLIQEEAYPIRVDISNAAPVLTVGSGDASFVSNYVYDTELTVIEAVPSGVPRRVEDFRYTYLETASGLGVETTILYVAESGIYGTDALTYSGGFEQIFSIPSGYPTRLETSNYGVDGQYIFVTVSGVTESGGSQSFYQQDPAQYIFNEFADGFPQSRATIIRLDDAV